MRFPVILRVEDDIVFTANFLYTDEEENEYKIFDGNVPSNNGLKGKMKEYDEVVIGSGVAGMSVAYGLKKAGKNVLIIEENLWGGTCPNRGCDPKKILLNSGDTLSEK